MTTPSSDQHPRETATLDERVLRRTRGTCPVCVEMVPARVVEVSGTITLVKTCETHGEHRVLLSRRPDYFAPLMAYYFDVMPESLPQRDYILRLTHRCNMQCPICLASSDEFPERDLRIDEVRALLAGRRRVKLDLMGAEPTLWPDLVPLIREAHAAGHITALHTNGLTIAREEDLRRLVDAGLDEVHLQFDGFSDEQDRVLRGRPMAEVRRQVLEGLERHQVATDLVVTLLDGVNLDQMMPILDFAAEHPFVKEVFYLGCRRLGRATSQFADQSLPPDLVIDEAEQRSHGVINRDDLRAFNKLYFAMLCIFRLRKCFYIHHYMVLREGKTYRPVSAYIDLPYLEPHLDRFRELHGKSRLGAIAYLLPHIGLAIARKGGHPLLLHGAILPVLLKVGFNLSRLKSRIILLGFISACDPWMHDEQIAANCGKGELATDLGLNQAGADANVLRERLHRRSRP